MKKRTEVCLRIWLKRDAKNQQRKNKLSKRQMQTQSLKENGYSFLN